jgi:hypothetical protein
MLGIDGTVRVGLGSREEDGDYRGLSFYVILLYIFLITGVFITKI